MRGATRRFLDNITGCLVYMGHWYMGSNRFGEMLDAYTEIVHDLLARADRKIDKLQKRVKELDEIAHPKCHCAKCDPNGYDAFLQRLVDETTEVLDEKKVKEILREMGQ